MGVALITNWKIARREIFALIVGTLCLGVVVPVARADGRLEREGSVRVSATYDKNPDDIDLYPNRYESSDQVLVRESLKFRGPRSLRFEFNAYMLAINSSDRTSLAQTVLNASDEVNRASALDLHWYRGSKLDGYLTIDRINMRGKIAGAEVTVGRFPVNLTTMAIFTPNDFFAPYRPTDFYRDYKPGVDAVRVDHSLGKKGQISAIGVVGYAVPQLVSRVGATNQGSNRFSAANSSALVRASRTWRGFEAAAFTGKLAVNNVVGATVQGEVGPVGLRGEVNQKFSRETNGLNRAAGAIGADYRLNPKLVITVEQFFNQAGFADSTGYAHLAESPPSSPILGRWYTGLAGLYDITPLIHLRSLLVANDGDQSFIGVFQLTYSVTERLELGLAALAPYGPPPTQFLPKSEFGSYPAVITVQASRFF